MSQYKYALQLSGSTVGFAVHMDRGVHSLMLIYMLVYPCTDAPLTGTLKNFRTSANNSGHGVNFRTFQDNF